jgi:hypothetical protein
MRKWWVALALGAAGLASGDAPRAAAPAPLKLLVPAYFYPAGAGVTAWNKLDAAAAQIPIVAIANPDSGPGVQADANYTATLNKAQQAGVTLIGYVSTSYGNRSLEAVKADIEVWAVRYPQISGFFLDEQASSAAKVDHYGQIYDYIKSQHPSFAAFSNPGTVCDPGYRPGRRPTPPVSSRTSRDSRFTPGRPGRRCCLPAGRRRWRTPCPRWTR